MPSNIYCVTLLVVYSFIVVADGCSLFHPTGQIASTDTCEILDAGPGYVAV